MYPQLLYYPLVAAGTHVPPTAAGTPIQMEIINPRNGTPVTEKE